MYSKYEEIYPPHIKDFIKACSKAYQKEDFIYMESEIMNLLDFKMARVTLLEIYEIVT